MSMKLTFIDYCKGFIFISLEFCWSYNRSKWDYLIKSNQKAAITLRIQLKMYSSFTVYFLIFINSKFKINLYAITQRQLAHFCPFHFYSNRIICQNNKIYSKSAFTSIVSFQRFPWQHTVYTAIFHIFLYCQFFA